MKKIKKVISLYQEIFLSLSNNLKVNFLKLMFFNIFLGLVDTIGVLSTAPLVAVLADSQILNSNFIFVYIQDFFNLNNKKSLLIFFSILTTGILILSLIGKLALRYLNLKFSNNVYFYYSNNLFKYFLKRDYLFHTQKSVFELITNTYTDAQRLQSQLITPILEICSNIIILFFLFCTLLYVNYYLTLFFTSFFLIFYSLYSILVFKKLSKYGKTITDNNPLFFQSLFDGIRGIREVKIYNKENTLSSDFSKKNKLIRNQFINIDILSNLPRHFIELISFVLIILTLNILILKFSFSFSEVLVLLSVYLLSLTKIIPALQRVYLNLASIGSHISTYYILRDYISDFKKNEDNIISSDTEYKEIKFYNKILFKDVFFKYPESNFHGLKNIEFEINFKDKIALIGESGSGKTTLIDLLAGLLYPTQGHISIDDEILNSKNSKLWQKKIAYVSQDIYLMNSSTAENICFSNIISENEKKKIVDILIKLNLKDLSSSIDKNSGEFGKRLSGGQKQRLAIARAIFRDSDFLIIDEGTSALDRENSKLILDYIFKLFNDKTIIFVCHSKSLFKRCNKFIYLEKGIIKSKGLINNLENLDNFKSLN